MKQLKKYWMLLVAIVFSSGITGCSNEEDTSNTPTGNPKEYTVTLGFSGEITDITESPLRDTANDLYGFQVYLSQPEKDDYKPYAHGLFDNTRGIVIKLLEGYKYKIESTMMVNAKNKVYKDSDNTYGAPFDWSKEATVDNKFYYDFYEENNDIHRGRTHLNNGLVGYHFNAIERFYGEIKDYNPTKNENLSIEMKKVFFGAKFIIEGMNTGKLNIKGLGITMHIEYPNTEIQDIFLFSGSDKDTNAWTADDYSENFNIDISWEKETQKPLPITSTNISFKRNKLTTITVQIKDKSEDIQNGISIIEEDTPMQPGDNITL